MPLILALALALALTPTQASRPRSYVHSPRVPFSLAPTRRPRSGRSTSSRAASPSYEAYYKPYALVLPIGVAKLGTPSQSDVVGAIAVCSTFTGMPYYARFERNIQTEVR